MTVAGHIYNSVPKNSKNWYPIVTGVALLKRFWWHTHAYLTILAMMILTLGALGSLHVYHWLTSKRFSISTQSNFKNANCRLIISK